MLSPNQVQNLLSIIDKNHLVFITKELGLEFLSDEDKKILTDNGINWEHLYSESEDSISTSYHLGLLADALKDNLNTISFSDLQDYISKGKYIPLTQRDRAVIKVLKSQTLKDVKTQKGKIFNDINQLLVDKSHNGQISFLKEQLEEGVLNKRTVQQIASDIAHLTGDWNRNFHRIVEYNCQQAYEVGKAENIRSTYGDNSLVYKTVYEKACGHCIAAYLTKGPGSAPKVFKLSELYKNGTNIGRKTKDWLPVLGPMHPYCRCSLHYITPSYSWNSSTKDFDIKTTPKRVRPLVDIKIGDRTYQV